MEMCELTREALMEALKPYLQTSQPSLVRLVFNEAGVQLFLDSVTEDEYPDLEERKKAFFDFKLFGLQLIPGGPYIDAPIMSVETCDGSVTSNTWLLWNKQAQDLTPKEQPIVDTFVSKDLKAEAGPHASEYTRNHRFEDKNITKLRQMTDAEVVVWDTIDDLMPAMNEAAKQVLDKWGRPEPFTHLHHWRIGGKVSRYVTDFTLDDGTCLGMDAKLVGDTNIVSLHRNDQKEGDEPVAYVMYSGCVQEGDDEPPFDQRPMYAMMDIIDSHYTNRLNAQIMVFRDTKGGLVDTYFIELPDGTRFKLPFHYGSLKEVEINGITNEILMAILVDRYQRWAMRDGSASAMNALFKLLDARGAMFPTHELVCQNNARHAPDYLQP